jgi:hypothetical protein
VSIRSESPKRKKPVIMPDSTDKNPPVEPGVWMVAGTSWGYEGPGYAIPYATELDALRAVNEETYLRAYFVPFGKDLQEVMNAPR